MTNNAVASLLTLVAVIAGCSLVGFTIGNAFRSGEFLYRDGPVYRERQPIAFWSSIAFNTVCMMLLTAIGCLCNLAVGKHNVGGSSGLSSEPSSIQI